MVSKRLLLAAAALAALALAGCSSTGPHSAFIPHADRAGLDPLLDAPLRTETVCKGAGLFTAGTKLAGFSFECPDLDVVATLNELRDAGWRVEKMHIGRQTIENDESERSARKRFLLSERLPHNTTIRRAPPNPCPRACY